VSYLPGYNSPLDWQYSDIIYLTIFNNITPCSCFEIKKNVNDFKPERTGKANDTHQEFCRKAPYLLYKLLYYKLSVFSHIPSQSYMLLNNIHTAYTWLSMLMKGKRHMNNWITWKIQVSSVTGRPRWLLNVEIYIWKCMHNVQFATYPRNIMTYEKMYCILNVWFVLDEVDFFNLLNPSSFTMAPGSTQPVTEMSTRNPPGGKKRLVHTADNLATIYEPNV
jgi:hypothetical protein